MTFWIIRRSHKDVLEEDNPAQIHFTHHLIYWIKFSYIKILEEGKIKLHLLAAVLGWTCN